MKKRYWKVVFCGVRVRSIGYEISCRTHGTVGYYRRCLTEPTEPVGYGMGCLDNSYHCPVRVWEAPRNPRACRARVIPGSIPQVDKNSCYTERILRIFPNFPSIPYGVCAELGVYLGLGLVLCSTRVRLIERHTSSEPPRIQPWLHDTVDVSETKQNRL